jgi:Leucine-rich repeat (LRR) protein
MIRISKFLFIFLIAIITNSCINKDELPAQKQEDAFVHENPLIHEIVENEEKINDVIPHDEPAKETKVGITLKYNEPKNDRIVYVDRNITEIKFFKVAIIAEIKGLDQLRHLDTIVLSKSYLDNLSFLTEVPRLKRLFIESDIQNVDWSLIEQLPGLEVLYIEKCNLPTISIDLKNNKHLEYLGFSYGILEKFPTLHNIPDSLKYLNLQSNKITSLPSDFVLYKHATIFLKINPFEQDASTPSNITMEWESNILEKKYYPPINMPFISDLGD